MRLEIFFVLLGCSFPTLANVEKSIFLAPGPNVGLPPSTSLEYLQHNGIRQWPASRQVAVPAAFPDVNHPLGSYTWFLFEDLRPHQRYEVRICWAATVSAFKVSPYNTIAFRFLSGNMQ